MNNQNLTFQSAAPDSIIQTPQFSRRQMLRMSVMATSGLAVASLLPKQAEAVAPDQFAFLPLVAELISVLVVPVFVDAVKHFIKGHVEASNDSPDPATGYVKVWVVDANDHTFDVWGMFGPYKIPAYSVANLRYKGLVPNGSGNKYIHVRSYVNGISSDTFYWS